MVDKVMQTLTFHQAITAGIAEEMRLDERVFLMGFEVSIRSSLQSEFGPRRILDTPISELAIMGMGVGAARRGMKPIIDLMGSSFFFLALDQMANQAAITSYLFNGQVPISLVVRGMTGIGQVAGAAHHGRMPHSMLLSIPGLKVVFPADVVAAKQLMQAAIRDPNPVIFLEHVRLYQLSGSIPLDSGIPSLGKAVIKRHGIDVTIVAIGPMVKEALAAADALEKEGISVEVIDLCSLSPLDYDTILRAVEATGRVVIVDEAYETCSVATHLAAIISKRAWGKLRSPVTWLCVPDTNIPFSPQAAFEQLVPGVAGIVAAVRAFFS